MTRLVRYDRTNAPAASRPFLEACERETGRIAEHHAVMAGAPRLLEACRTLEHLLAETRFDARERALLHCLLLGEEDGGGGRGRDEAEPPWPPGSRLEALGCFLEALVHEADGIDAAARAFLAAGYSRGQMLEVALVASHGAMRRYTRLLAGLG